MKAGLRWGWEFAAAAAFALSPAPALAQDPGQSATQNAVQPATNAIGPRALQNFNLQGTVTKPAPTAPATNEPAAPTARAAPPPASPASRPATVATERSAPPPAPSIRASAEPPSGAPPRTLTVRTAEAPPAIVPSLTPGAEQAAGTSSLPAPSVPASDAGHISILPWLLAALLVVGAGLFLFWRNRSRMEFAGASGFEAFDPELAPIPQPTPKPMPRAAVSPTLPAPLPTPPAPPAPAGIVSTRLRPWIELAVEPVHCILDDEKVAIEFELELFNSGNAPARAVLVEARLVNAGRQQDQDLSAFFANPVGEGQRIATIPPLKRIAFRSRVVTERQHLQIYNVEGRKVFVPLLAFNVLYSWSSGEGQSSLSYLIGRDTKGERMAPFRADLGDRTFEGLGKQLLPVGLRQ